MVMRDHIKNIMPRAKTFTITDLLIAQLLFAIFLGLVFLIINPGKRLEEQKQKVKLRDINVLSEAINQYSKDHPGTVSKNFPEFNLAVEIKKNNGGVGDLCWELVPKYIPELPVNPDLSAVPIRDCSKDYVTGYLILLKKDGKVEVSAK